MLRRVTNREGLHILQCHQTFSKEQETRRMKKKVHKNDMKKKGNIKQPCYFQKIIFQIDKIKFFFFAKNVLENLKVWLH